VSDRLAIHFVHPGNPRSPDPDGVVTVQRNFVAAAPDDLDFVYWGVRRPGERHERGGLGHDRLPLRPVVSSQTQRPLIPLSLKFAARMVAMRRRIKDGVLRFDRVESAVPFLRSPLPKVLFLHTWNSEDIRNEHSESKWRWTCGAHDRLFDHVVRRVDLVYALRPDMAAELARRDPAVASRLRPFGVPVDVSIFAPLPRGTRRALRAELCDQLSIPADAPLVLFAGRLEGQKRPLVLPAVASAMASEVHVLVAGSGTLQSPLAEAARREAHGRVHLLGSVAQRRVASLMAVADALLLPSAFEGMPNVVLEALAAGTPVVAARHGGRTGELLSGRWTGLVSGPDAADMARALQKVLGWRGRGWEERRLAAEAFGPKAVNGPVYEDLRRLWRSKRGESVVGSVDGDLARIGAGPGGEAT
jgi:glycosyltransferase involved in cell wall biosynthesis